MIGFGEELEFLKTSVGTKKNIPVLITKLNLFADSDGLLKVKSKFASSINSCFPILLPKNSCITDAVIWDMHLKMRHAGLYSTIKELRSKFWIEHCFSTVKKVLNKCTLCRRLNHRPVSLNQSAYR